MATASAEWIDPGDIMPLNPNEIELRDERLRPIDIAWATAIGRSMKRDGQIHAVEVKRTADGGWVLAGAGGHRVTGARLANIPIDVKVVMFDDDFARRREAAENLFRRANDPLERARAIAELVRLHRERAGDEAARHRGKSLPKRLANETKDTLDIVSNVYGWSEEIGDEIGLNGRTVRRDLFLYRSLRPSVVALLREHRHPVLKNAAQLRALAKLEAGEQERAATKLIDVGYGSAKSVSEAIRMVRGANSPAMSVEDKRLSTFIGTFQRMGLAEKRGALAQLAGMLPAPFSLVEGASVAAPSKPTGGR